MLGSIVNAVLIVVGSLTGLLLKRGFPEKFKSTIMQGMALAVVLVGMQMAIRSKDILVVILSLAIGALLGELIDIEAKLEKLGAYLQTKVAGSGESKIAEGFVTASLVYCVGAMAIMGALQSGLENKHTTLIAKGLIDGVTAIVFASTLGVGVMFSAVSVFIYQGSITLLARWINVLLTEAIVLEMSAVGGLLIAAIGFNLLKMTKIRVGNLLPAVFIPIFLIRVLSIIQ